MTKDFVRQCLFLAIGMLMATASSSQCDQNYDWAVWTSFTGMEATGTITTPNGPISVTMTTNYTFDSTPGIYNYGVFSAFNDPPPNSTVPRTTWAAGPGGETTMCFSETVTNPVLLLSSVGNPGLPVTLEFSLPYQVVFDGGGMTWVNSTTLIGQEGYGIIVFPGDFDCVTIYSSTPENYTNITWGINPPLFDVEIDGDTVACVSTTLTASGGLTYAWDGGQNPNSPSNTFTESGQYGLTVTDAAGCEVITSIQVTIHPEEEESLEAAICEGESFLFDGQLLDQAGYYESILQTYHGCDSTVSLLLDVWPVDWQDLTVTICEGEFFPFDNNILDQAGFYLAELQNNYGCDSTVTLELIVLPTSIETIDMQICEGEVLDFHGQTLTDAGIYTADLQNGFGCDSTVILSLDVLPATSTPLAVDLCTGQSYLFHGDTLTKSGTYQADLQSEFGCDSTIILSLNILQATTSNMTLAVCQGESFDFYGDTLVAPGIYTVILANQAGCDSTITLDFKVNSTPSTHLHAQICAGQTYPFQGMNLNTPGTYTSDLQTTQGCDSTVQLTLDVVAIIKASITDVICQGSTYSFNGMTLSSPGMYADTLLSNGGCDSVVTLTLSVMPNPTSNVQGEICDGKSYDFQGDFLTSAGQYTEILSSWTGCDSTITLQLTVHPNTSKSIQAQICSGQSYAFNGQTLTTPGAYIANLQTSHGCDSTVTLTLNVATVLKTDIEAAICAGESYTFGSEQLTVAGLYKDSLVSSGGCDSLVTLVLAIYQDKTEVTSMAICQGEQLVFEGDTLNAGGQYSALFQTIHGCDSTHILNLAVHPSYDQIDLVNACDFYTWPVNGQTYTQNTTFTLPAQSIYGCDSTRQLILTVHSSSKDVDSVTTNAPSYLWPVDKRIYSQSGIYTTNSTTASGCDSIHILHLTFIRTGIYIPTAFSPNEDGINDRFTIYGGEDLSLIEVMTFYDRWGNKLATYSDLPPGDPRFGWDGRSRDLLMDPAVYIFTASVLMTDGTHQFLKGEVTLVK